jgi:hypothetical protein
MEDDLLPFIAPEARELILRDMREHNRRRPLNGADANADAIFCSAHNMMVLYFHNDVSLLRATDLQHYAGRADLNPLREPWSSVRLIQRVLCDMSICASVDAHYAAARAARNRATEAAVSRLAVLNALSDARAYRHAVTNARGRPPRVWRRRRRRSPARGQHGRWAGVDEGRAERRLCEPECPACWEAVERTAWTGLHCWAEQHGRAALQVAEPERTWGMAGGVGGMYDMYDLIDFDAGGPEDGEIRDDMFGQPQVERREGESWPILYPLDGSAAIETIDGVRPDGVRPDGDVWSASVLTQMSAEEDRNMRLTDDVWPPVNRADRP